MRISKRNFALAFIAGFLAVVTLTGCEKRDDKCALLETDPGRPCPIAEETL